MNISSLRKILGDILTRKGRTALVSFAIFIGVVGVIVLITAGNLLVAQLREDIKEDELPMIENFVNTTADAEGQIDNEAELARLEALPGVTRVEGQANQPFFWRLGEEGRFRESRILAFSEPFDEVQLQPVRLVEGAYPRAGNKELAIEKRMADEFDIAVGDGIAVNVVTLTESGEIVGEELWTITGIVFHPYNEQSDETMYATYEDAGYIGGFQGLTSINARYVDYPTAQANLDTFSSAIADETSYIAVFNQSEDPAENSYVQNTQDFALILAVLAVVAMLVSGFLVINVITNLVVEQRKQIGVMKSLGATRGETFMMYAGIAVIYGLLGVIPGVIVGVPAGYEMAVIIGDLSNTLIDEFAISPLAIVLGVGLGLGVPVLSAVIPVFNGTKVTILEAMTDLGISSNTNTGFLTRTIRRLPVPMNIRMSLTSVSQKKSRLLLTVTTLTLAVTAFMGVTAVFVQLNDTLQDLLSTFQYDVQIQPTNSQDYEEIRTLIKSSITDVADVFPGTAASVQVDGYVSSLTNTSQLLVTGFDHAAPLLQLDYVEGDGWAKDPTREGIVLTNEVADQLGKGVDDTIILSSSGKQLELEIIGVANFPFDLGFMQWETLANFAGYTQGAPKPNQYFTTLAVTDYDGTLNNSLLTAWGIDEQTASFLEMIEGAALVAGENQVIITQAVADNAGIGVGDVLPIQMPGAEPSETFTVTGIFSPPAQLAQSGQVPEDLVAFNWQELATLEGRSLEGDVVPNVFFVISNLEEPTERDIDALIEDVNDLLLENGITASYQNQVEVTNDASESILSVGIVLNIASFVMAAVGAIGLLTTLSISVFERQKEIGVMRSVGAKSPVIVIQFVVEGLVVGIIAWIIAVPLSVGLAYVLTDLLPFAGFIEFGYSPLMPLVGIIGILILAFISSLWPSVQASRKTVSEILRYQ
jgi:putative ABC transport system permease protein